MNPVGTHGQGCLTDEEYGAVALAMQCNRDAVDAALTTDQVALDGYNNRPWVQMTSTVAVAQLQTLLEWTPFTSWYGWTIMNNTTATNTVVSAGMGNTFVAGGFPTGWWNIGGYASYQPTGATTANSRRQLCIQVNHSVQFDQVYDTIINTGFDSASNPDSLTVNDIFFLNNQFSYGITLGFAHRNAASTIQANVGARIWANYLGVGVNL